MKKTSILTLLVVQSLREVERQNDYKEVTCPASMIYLGLGMNMPTFEEVAACIRRTELATITHETITLTARGREIADMLISME